MSRSPLRFAVATLLLGSAALALVATQPAWAQTRPDARPKTAAKPAPVDLSFLPQMLPKAADAYEAALKAQVKPAKATVADALADGQRLMSGAGRDPRAAAQAFREAAVLDRTQAAAWLRLAETLLMTVPDPQKAQERAELATQATSAAMRGIEMAQNATDKAGGLHLLHEALKRRGMYRPAITALKASVALADVAERRTQLTQLIAEHGFRIVDTKVDADATQPRACVVFSETLAGGKVDFAPFLKVDGKDPMTVTSDGKQVCVDGLKHGQRYTLQVRAGLPSSVGEPLLKTVDLVVGVRDRSPSVRAAGRAYVLPKTGQQGLPLTTINTAALDIEIYRVGDRNLAATLQSGDFQRNVSSYDLEQLRERSGQRVYQGVLETQSKLNEDVTTAFPVSDAVGRLEPGVYVLSAAIKNGATADGERDTRKHASQWFIVSDLGLSALSGRDGVHVFVRSLDTAAVVPGAKVRLVARNNEILGETVADARGYAHFDAGLKRGEGGLQPAFVSAEGGGDYAFLDLAAAAFDLTDRGVKGRDAPGPVDAFTFADRGVYRPGETVHLTSLVRDAEARAATLPVTLVVSRPDGVEHSRAILQDKGAGGRTHALALSGGAMTGTWRARVYTDPKAAALSTTAFLVEDFTPERLDLKLEAATPQLEAGKGGQLRVQGKYLYGPPAAGLSIEGEVIVKPSTRGLDGYSGYRFGAADEKIAPMRAPLEDLPQTDDAGGAVLNVTLPPLERTARALDADVLVRLREPGGRTIERSLKMPVMIGAPRIGIKPLFGAAEGLIQAADGDAVAFDVITLDKAGKATTAKGLTWELSRLEQRWQWYSRDGEWSYNSQTSTRRVATGSFDASADKPERITAKVDWGRYRLDVRSTTIGDTAPLAASVEFNAGYWHDEGADSPEMLDIALDKPSYKVGDVARVRVQSRTAGKVQVTVLGSSQLIAQEQADIPAGGGEVRVPVTAAWGAGAYVSVTHYRPLDQGQKRMPGRALGIKWAPVDQDARTLKVALDAPAMVRPNTSLTLPVKVSGLVTGEAAHIVVAATDAGILNLTRYETPKPEAWFYGQRKLGHDVRDFYARLIDGMKAERGRLRSGGDGGAAESMATSGAPPVEATLALFSGVVTVGADGTAPVTFDLPDFNGALRLNAIAWSASGVGHATRDVIVRDKVAMTVAAPRFLTLGDEARLRLDLNNVEAPSGDYRVSVTRGAQSLAASTVALKAGQRSADMLTLKPTDVGAMTVDVAVTGPGDVSIKRTLTFDVKPPAGNVRRSTVATLSAKGGKLTLSRDMLTDLVPSTAQATVMVGPMAKLNVPGLLAELDRYPYGCAEQTTSRALPLLYANDVARQIGLGADGDIRQRVAGAIARLGEMQDASGAFGIWGPANGDMWLTSYVTDFLVRARESGHAVNAKVVTLALDKLANSVTIAQDRVKDGDTRAYALYVLARAGRAPAGELKYAIDGQLDQFGTALSLAQLGAAAQLIGDTARAELAFAAAMKKVNVADTGATRHDYGSGLRDSAAVLTLASETRMATAATTSLADVIAKVYASRTYTSTQEQAWMLLAAKSLGAEAADVTLNVNGTAHRGRFVRALKTAELRDGALTIENTAETATQAIVSVIGSALTPEPAVEKGFKIERHYYTLDGKPVDLASARGGAATLAQNERLVVVLKVTADSDGGRILLVDGLPAGLEIENPRIVDGGDVEALDWLKTTRSPEHTEFRDDRFVAAFDFFGANARRRGGDDGDDTRGPTKTATVAYVVRAVTPGSFVHPAATVEDMYRPERHARTAAGRLTISAK